MKFLPGKDPIDFNEKEHKYSLNGETFISVSTLIHLYCPTFDETGEILQRCAAKRQITPEELQKEWDFERDSACDRGHLLHREAEYWIDHKKFKKGGKYTNIIKQIAEIPFKGKLRSETIIYDKELKIAGTVDLIEEISPGIANVWDFKQNKKLAKKSFFERGKGYSYMLYPVNHVMNCNFYHYSLQLEIYSILLERNDFQIKDKCLIYAAPKSEKIELHPILPLRKEAEDIIGHFSF